MVGKELQPLKAEFPMLCTFGPICTSVMLEQPEKELVRIAVIPFPIFAKIICEQFWNAYSPRFVVIFGIMILCSEEQPSKAEFPMKTILSPNNAVCNSVQDLKALSPKLLTFFPISNAFIPVAPSKVDAPMLPVLLILAVKEPVTSLNADDLISLRLFIVSAPFIFELWKADSPMSP